MGLSKRSRASSIALDALTYSSQEKTVVLKSKLWLLNYREGQIRAKLDEITGVKILAKRHLIDFRKQINDEASRLQCDLEQINRDEEAMRNDLNEITLELVDLQQRRAAFVEIERSRNQSSSLWAMLERMINLRNEKYSRLERIVSLLACITALLNAQCDPVSSGIELIEEHFIKDVIARLLNARDRESKLQARLMQVLLSREETASMLCNSVLSPAKESKASSSHLLMSFPQTASHFQHLLKKCSVSSPSNGEETTMTILAYQKLSSLTLEALSKRIHASGLIRDRNEAGRFFACCFVGAELVTWFIKAGVISNREEGVVLGTLFFRHDLIYQVKDKVSFQDSYNQVYRFRSDDVHICSVTKTGWLWKLGQWRFRPRYFVWDLRQKLLSCYRNKNETVACKVFWIADAVEIKSAEHKDDGNRFFFEIHFVDRILVLASPTSRERSQWLRSLGMSKCTCHLYVDNPDPDASHSDECPSRFAGRSAEDAASDLYVSRAKSRLEWARIFSSVVHVDHRFMSSLFAALDSSPELPKWLKSNSSAHSTPSSPHSTSSDTHLMSLHQSRSYPLHLSPQELHAPRERSPLGFCHSPGCPIHLSDPLYSIADCPISPSFSTLSEPFSAIAPPVSLLYSGSEQNHCSCHASPKSPSPCSSSRLSPHQSLLCSSPTSGPPLSEPFTLKMKTHLHELFSDAANPIGKLFAEFHRLFVTPFFNPSLVQTCQFLHTLDSLLVNCPLSPFDSPYLRPVREHSPSYSNNERSLHSFILSPQLGKSGAASKYSIPDTAHIAPVEGNGFAPNVTGNITDPYLLQSLYNPTSTEKTVSSPRDISGHRICSEGTVNDHVTVFDNVMIPAKAIKRDSFDLTAVMEFAFEDYCSSMDTDSKAVTSNCSMKYKRTPNETFERTLSECPTADKSLTKTTQPFLDKPSSCYARSPSTLTQKSSPPRIQIPSRSKHKTPSPSCSSLSSSSGLWTSASSTDQLRSPSSLRSSNPPNCQLHLTVPRIGAKSFSATSIKSIHPSTLSHMRTKPTSIHRGNSLSCTRRLFATRNLKHSDVSRIATLKTTSTRAHRPYHLQTDGKSARRAAHDRLDAVLRNARDDVMAFVSHLQRLLEHILSERFKISCKHRLLIQDCVCSYVFDGIYDVLFPLYKQRYQYMDLRLNKKVEEIKHVTTAEFGLSKDLCFDVEEGIDDPYQSAVVQFEKISHITAPQDKLNCITEVARCICACVNTQMNKQNTSKKSSCIDDMIIGADDLLLLFALIISRSNVFSIHAEIRIMEDYIAENQKTTVCGYYLATLQAATELLRTIANHDIISPRKDIPTPTKTGVQCNATNVYGLAVTHNADSTTDNTDSVTVDSTTDNADSVIVDSITDNADSVTKNNDSHS